MKRLLCRLFGHRWLAFVIGRHAGGGIYARVCKRCSREEWVAT